MRLRAFACYKGYWCLPHRERRLAPVRRDTTIRVAQRTLSSTIPTGRGSDEVVTSSGHHTSRRFNPIQLICCVSAPAGVSRVFSGRNRTMSMSTIDHTNDSQPEVSDSHQREHRAGLILNTSDFSAFRAVLPGLRWRDTSFSGRIWNTVEDDNRDVSNAAERRSGPGPVAARPGRGYPGRGDVAVGCIWTPSEAFWGAYADLYHTTVEDVKARSEVARVCYASFRAPPGLVQAITTEGMERHQGLIGALLQPGVQQYGFWVHAFHNVNVLGFLLNAQNRRGKTRVSACLRYKSDWSRKTFSMSACGFFALGLDGDTGWAAYRDLSNVEKWLDLHVWAISRQRRNAIMHALNGNTSRPSSRRDRTADRRDPQPRASPELEGMEEDGFPMRCVTCTRAFVLTRQTCARFRNDKRRFPRECRSCQDAAADAMGAGLGDLVGRSGSEALAARDDRRDVSDSEEDGPAGPRAAPEPIVHVETTTALNALLGEAAGERAHSVSGSFCKAPIEAGGPMFVLGAFEDLAELSCWVLNERDVHVITPLLVEPEETHCGLRCVRASHDFSSINIGGCNYRDNEWVYDGSVQTIAGCQYSFREVDRLILAGSNVAVIHFMLRPSALAPAPRVVRSESFDDGTYTYASYAGPKRTVIRVADESCYVDTQLYRETSRYYVGTDAAVATSHVMGALKHNNTIAGKEIRLLTAYLSARLHRDGPRHARLVYGRRETKLRLAAIRANAEETCPWWYPAPLRWLLDPYETHRVAALRWVLALVLVCAALMSRNALTEISLTVYRFCLGYAPVVYEFASAAATEAGTRLGDAGEAAGDAFRRASFDPPDDYAWYDYLANGVFHRYWRYTMLGTRADGWLAHAAVLAGGTLHHRFWVWLVDSMSLYNLLIIFAFPFFEELIRRSPGEVAGVDVTIPWNPTFYPAVRRLSLRLSSVLGFLLASVEAYYLGLNGGLLAGFARFVFQMSLGFMPFWLALPVHTVFNWVVLTLGGMPASVVLMDEQVATLAFALVLYAYRRRIDNNRYRILAGMFPDTQFYHYFQCGASKFPIKDGSEVRCRRQVHATKPGNEMVQVMAEFAPMRSFAKVQGNILHSLLGRVVKMTPGFQAAPLHAMVYSHLSKKMGHVEPWPYERWVSRFPPAKRDRYLAAYERLQVLGLAAFNEVLLGGRNGWRKLKAFMKHEANLVQLGKTVDGWDIACADPRTIQACCDEMHALVGPFFSAAGERASEVFDGTAESSVCGVRILMAFGHTKAAIGKILVRLCSEKATCVVICGDDVYIIWHGRCIAIDATRWDAHVDLPLLGLRVPHYVDIGMPPAHAAIVHRLDTKTGSFQGMAISYKTKGGVTSGRSETLYANTTDGAVICVSAILCSKTWDDFVAYAGRCGIVYEVAAECTRTYFGADLDFCASVLTPTAEGLTLVGKLGKGLAKGCYVMHGDIGVLHASKIQALSRDFACFPEVTCELRRMLAHLPKAGPTDISYFPSGCPGPAPIRDREEFFAARYGLSYTDVVGEVREWVDRSIAGDLDAGDLVNLRALVAKDFGKEPVACPSGGHRKRRKPTVRLRRVALAAAIVAAIASFCLMLPGLPEGGPEDGRLVLKILRTGQFPEQQLGYQQKSLETMKKNQQKQNAPRRPQSKPKSAKPRQKITAMGRTLRAGGAALGRATGYPGGALVGRLAGMAISKITGNGDYVVTANTIHREANSGSQIPSFKATGREVRITHREYIGDISSPGSAFTINGFPINPGEQKTFPWLHTVARHFQKYRFNGLVFSYRTNSSDYSAAAGLGAVVMATNYNSADASYTTKQQMENSAYAVSCKPSQDMMHPVECAKTDRAAEWYYVKDGVNPVSAAQLYDLGDFYIATQGLSAVNGTTMGELWCTYDITFLEPILPLPTSSSAGSYWHAPPTYVLAGSTFQQGPWLNSTNVSSNDLIANLNPIAGPGVATLAVAGGGYATLATSSGALMVTNLPTVSTSTNTAHTENLWFARNGIYLYQITVDTLSTALLTSPWTVSGVGATASLQVEAGNFATCNVATITYLINVTGVDLNTPSAPLPVLNFTTSSTTTFKSASANFSILA